MDKFKVLFVASVVLFTFPTYSASVASNSFVKVEIETKDKKKFEGFLASTEDYACVPNPKNQKTTLFFRKSDKKPGALIDFLGDRNFKIFEKVAELSYKPADPASIKYVAVKDTLLPWFAIYGHPISLNFDKVKRTRFIECLESKYDHYTSAMTRLDERQIGQLKSPALSLYSKDLKHLGIITLVSYNSDYKTPKSLEKFAEAFKSKYLKLVKNESSVPEGLDFDSRELDLQKSLPENIYGFNYHVSGGD